MSIGVIINLCKLFGHLLITIEAYECIRARLAGTSFQSGSAALSNVAAPDGSGLVGTTACGVGISGSHTIALILNLL